MTTRRMRIACWIPRATNTLGICNTYCFSTTTMVALVSSYVLMSTFLCERFKDRSFDYDLHRGINWRN